MSKINYVIVTPGRSGYKVVVDVPVGEDNYSHYVSDMFDLHRTLDRLFPPQKPERSLADEFRAEIADKAGK